MEEGRACAQAVRAQGHEISRVYSSDLKHPRSHNGNGNSLIARRKGAEEGADCLMFLPKAHIHTEAAGEDGNGADFKAVDKFQVNKHS